MAETEGTRFDAFIAGILQRRGGIPFEPGDESDFRAGYEEGVMARTVMIGEAVGEAVAVMEGKAVHPMAHLTNADEFRMLDYFARLYKAARPFLNAAMQNGTQIEHQAALSEAMVLPPDIEAALESAARRKPE